VIKVIAFDLDGTLFDHNGSAGNAIRRVVQENRWSEFPDIEVKWQELEGIYFAQFANGKITFEEQRKKRMADLMSFLGVEAEHPVEKYFQDYLRYYTWQAFPEVDGVLRELAGMDLPLAVLTNGQSMQQNQKLSQLRIAHYFNLVLASDELLEFKPHPSAFLSISSFFGVEPEEVIYVGDSFEIDVIGATAAGLRTIWIDREPEQTEKGNFESLPNLTGVPRIIQEINERA
jgi:putative hydrolase of the HAD superfamily